MNINNLHEANKEVEEDNIEQENINPEDDENKKNSQKNNKSNILLNFSQAESLRKNNRRFHQHL